MRAGVGEHVRAGTDPARSSAKLGETEGPDDGHRRDRRARPRGRRAVFLNKVVRAYPRRELHVIFDNSSTHGTAEIKSWLAQHSRVRFHYTPTSASWQNQVEGFFGVLGKQSLGQTNFPSKKALREQLAASLRAWNAAPSLFEWTKPAAAIIRSH